MSMIQTYKTLLSDYVSERAKFKRNSLKKKKKKRKENHYFFMTNINKIMAGDKSNTKQETKAYL